MRFAIPSRFLVAVFLVAAAYFAFRPAQHSDPVPSISAESGPAKAGSTASIARGPALPAIPSAPPPAGYVKAVLPELGAHVPDWRAFTPSSIVLQLEPDLRVAFDVTQVETHPGRTVLTARLQGVNPDDHPLAGSFLVGTAVAADRWDAIVTMPTMEYRVTVRSTFATVEEAAPTDFACGAEHAGTIEAEPQPTPGATAGDTHAPLTVDVLFLYNPSALADRNNDVQAIEADASNYVASANAVLANSRVDAFRWNFLGIEATPAYASGESLSDDLRALRGTGEISRFVFDTQIPRGADQVVLLAGGVKKPAAGTAWLGSDVAHCAVAYPYPTLSSGERSTRVTSFGLIAHELGHNFNCRHHRDAHSEDTTDGNGQYNYGHITPDNFGTTMTSSAGTSHSLIAYYSTPEVTFRGQPVGLAAEHPRAAHNARTLAEHAPRVAGLEERPSAVPVITRQPQNAAFAPGERLSLSVAATGGGLTYEWKLNGTTIPPVGAEISATDFGADLAGTYTVTVKNSFGSVTSEPAIVSVAAPPPPAPPPTAPPPAGSSSGGGGGSSPAVFTVVLVILGFARYRRSACPPRQRAPV